MVVYEFAFVFDDFGIDESNKIGIFLVIHIFADDNDALIVAELGGGHSGGKFELVFFFPIFAGSAHLRDNIFNFRCDLANFGGLLA